MRRILGVTTLVVVALSVVLIGTASAAKPAPTTASGCPNGGTYLVDPNVGADATGTTTRTYTFHSWVDQNPVNGIPGLVGFCVYANQAAGTVIATAAGDNGQTWKTSKAGQTFSFLRPGGEKSNIGLDGTDTVMGTATFPNAESNETLLLHVSDAETCQDLYGGDATTCFVLPGPKPGPVCDAGNGETGVGYNSIPFDVEHCSPPSYAFEGNFANEFGDEVTLETGGGNKIQSMTVDFQSYGCSDSGRWYTADCQTIAGETFTIPGGITAKIYDPTIGLDPGDEIASATINPAIPFRPSAISDANCPNAPGGNPADSRFKDPVSGLCNYSLSVPLTFAFAGQTLPDTVVWTVQFNTTHGGYSPIGEGEACAAGGVAPGCGYDSLNVGAKTYPGSEYAGSDVDEDTVYYSTGNLLWAPPLVPLGADTDAVGDWLGFRPLAEIVLGQ